MLGHSKGSNTTRNYVHKLDAALIAAADRVAEGVIGMMEGNAPTAGGFDQRTA